MGFEEGNKRIVLENFFFSFRGTFNNFWQFSVLALKFGSVDNLHELLAQISQGSQYLALALVDFFLAFL